jgi:hypothetical protein
MPERLPGREVLVVDSFEPKTAQNGPVVRVPQLSLRPWLDWRTFRAPVPSFAMVEWLWRLIPPGALVVPIGGKIADGTKNYRLDRYDTRGVPCLPDAADPPLPPRDRHAQHSALAERMPEAHQRDPGRHAPRTGVDKWSIEAAFYRDLVGLSTTQIGDDLDLRDDSSRDSGNGSRSARRYITRGRRQLVQLGAWPWALQPRTNGRLPKGWHRGERFARALAEWHYLTTTATLRDCLRTTEAAAGSTERAITTTVTAAAEAAYRAVYEHRAAAAPNE